MKLVIDIPEETYKEVKWHGLFLCPRDSSALVTSIKNGAPYEERPHGEWKEILPFSTGKCSLCGNVANITNFCPNCGADMREGEAE